MSKFLAIDGEGHNEGDAHLYTMLCTSDGRVIEDSSGLDTFRILEFLFTLKQEGTHIVGFGLSYDINKWIKDLALSRLRILHTFQEVTIIIRGVKWHLTYIPHKFFRVTKRSQRTKQTITVWDVFGFFQSSFVKALEEWNIGSKEERTRIAEMKKQRGKFVNLPNEQVKQYCFSECQLLVDMMDSLNTEFKRCELNLKRFDGAGAGAACLMERYGIKEYVRTFDTETENIFLKAYYGGRSEVFKLGDCGDVYNYDINSAYPSAARYLPCLDGRFEQRTTYVSGLQYALWEVEWQLPPDEFLSPFPYRSEGRIYYARNGRGWYHGSEVDTACRLYGQSVRVLRGIEFIPATTAKPFGFIEEVYHRRLAYKKAGNRAQHPLKLSLNSIYGKLAQALGFHGSKPTYQSYFWAGYITAHCRARILEAVYATREHLVGIATDGIFTTMPIDVRSGEGLGEWGTKVYRDFFSAQAGIYCGTDAKTGKRIQRNRGFSSDEIEYDALIAEYRKRGIGARVTFNSTRFITLGASFPTFKNWGTWLDAKRKLTMNYGVKFPGKIEGRLYLPETRGESEAYKPKEKTAVELQEKAKFDEFLTSFSA